MRHGHGEPYIVAVYMLFNRYRQRYGGYLVHLGLIMLAVGVIGSHFFQQQTDAVLKAGQEINVSGYRLLYMGNIDAKETDKEIITSQLQIWRGGQLQGYIYPGRTFYRNFDNQPASQISITTFGLTDFYVLLDNWDGLSQATMRVFINPLVSLVWYGGVLMLLGGIICWWPARRRVAAVSVAARTSSKAASEATELADGGVRA